MLRWRRHILTVTDGVALAGMVVVAGVVIAAGTVVVEAPSWAVLSVVWSAVP